MQDGPCVTFLQWALPRMDLRWPGFRRVRGQVCKRLQRRLRELRLPDLEAYSHYCLQQPEEWKILEALCRISISRFYRDRGLFTLLGKELLPELATQVGATMDNSLRIWCAGCASGEEPYSLALVWAFQLAANYPDIHLQILASDIDPQLLQRAARARYRDSSLKELPSVWKERAFSRVGDDFHLRQSYRRPVQLLQHDLRGPAIKGPFQLILCRNLAFTYFSEPLQRQVLEKFQQVLLPGGCLVIGSHEALPISPSGFSPLNSKLGIYRKAATPLIPPVREGCSNNSAGP
ncbi:MAG: chemotaxis protein CheR [Chloroflexi bacterium]|nr:chemotaxis protein CheR [Chloroflexota bacterium]